MATEIAGRASALALLDWDHLHFYVGNAKQAAYYYAAAFGFDVIGYAGPETGVPGRASYYLVQNDLRFVLTSALAPDDPVAKFVALHGDGIRDIALRVPDARAAFAEAVAHGAQAIAEPAEARDEHGSVVTATIATYGDTVHTFVQRQEYRGTFLPGFRLAESRRRAAAQPGLRAVDHCVGNVGWNEMDRWTDYYARSFGFSQLVSFDDKDISTDFTALRSKVMSDDRHRVKFPINEPAEGLKRSQIEEYLDFYRGAGVQHVAIATDDIVAAVRALRANGVEFLETPASYYDVLEARVGKIDEAVEVLRELSILVDRDDLGYMLQIFTKPLQDRPTLFFEIIQRRGSLSFGKGNFKALFVAIEEEQGKRGNL
ncbi:MAG: 4-hydroxyphenylpyruvate dioxygenase [Candidatus Eremiobacteraeota bacterium]|nr:4-hydroxyphenylpyruvate dioxygenase [Candidatus Eremiobacteraeota bacterium]